MAIKKEDCFCLGKVVKPFGLHGEVVLFLDVDDPSEYLSLGSVLLEVKDSLIPFTIDSLRIKNNKATVKFGDISVEESLSLIGKYAYLPLELLPKLEGNRFYFHEVIGFRIVDEQKGDIGPIVSVLEYPNQPVFQVDCDGKEVLIPMVDPIIQKVDRDNQTIYIQAPEGLIDVFLT